MKKSTTIILSFIITLFLMTVIVVALLLIPGLSKKERSSCQSASQQVMEIQKKYSAVESTLHEEKIYIPQDEEILYDAESDLMYVDNTILIYFKPEASESDMETCIETFNGIIVGGHPKIRKYTVKFPASSLSELEQIASAIEKKSFVETTSIDYVTKIEPSTLPNDPWKRGGEADLANFSWDSQSPNGRNWWLTAIQAPEAWIYADNQEHIKIGIVDQGVDLSHEDLQENVQVSQAISNVSSDHGTHVAGIIAASYDNGLGISGTIQNITLLSYDWEEAQAQGKKTSVSILAGALSSMVTEGVKIVNYSLNLNYKEGIWATDKYLNYLAYTLSKDMHQLLVYGYDFLVVQSAGNGALHSDGRTYAIDASKSGFFNSIDATNCYSANGFGVDDYLGRIITVGSAQLTTDGKREFMMSEFSNGGERVDIYAPGSNIYSTVSNNYYQTLSGTSMAAPIVTAVCGAVWSSKTELTAKEVKSIVCNPENTNAVVLDNPSDLHPLTGEHYLVNYKLSVEQVVERAPSCETIPGKCTDMQKAYIDYESDVVTQDDLDKVGNRIFYAKTIDGGRVLLLGDKVSNNYGNYWENVEGYLLNSQGNIVDIFKMDAVERAAELGLPSQEKSIVYGNSINRFLFIDNHARPEFPYKPELFVIRDDEFVLQEYLPYSQLGIFFGRGEDELGALYGKVTAFVNFKRSVPFKLIYEEGYDGFNRVEMLPFDEQDEVVESFVPEKIVSLEHISGKNISEVKAILGAEMEQQEQDIFTYLFYEPTPEFPYYLDMEFYGETGEMLGMVVYSQAPTIPYYGKYSPEYFGFTVNDDCIVVGGLEESVSGESQEVTLTFLGLVHPEIDTFILSNVYEQGYSALTIYYK